jgi:hypothetical protein
MQLVSITQAIEGWLLVDSAVMSEACRHALQTQVNALRALHPHIAKTHWENLPMEFEIDD